MYSLILKDVLIQKKMLLFSFVYIIFFFIVMQGTGFALYSTSLTAITYMLIITSCAYDDRNKADVMLNSLPLKRKSIVLAKYLSIFVYMAVCTAAYMITTALISLTGLPLQTYPVSVESLVGGVFAIGLISSIYYPVYFKLGYIRSRFLNLILFFGLFFGFTSAANYYVHHQDAAWIQNLLGLLQTLSDLQLVLFLAVIFIMLAASLALSVKIYQNREF